MKTVGQSAERATMFLPVAQASLSLNQRQLLTVGYIYNWSAHTVKGFKRIELQ